MLFRSGVAHELAHMATIYPQKYDIPVDFVVTERGIYRREGGRVGGREEDREGDRDGNRDSDCECDRDGALEFLDAPSPGRTQSDPEPLSSPVCYANSPELRKDQP